jgi:enoyl-CoA hydratase/carnithine racemase
VLVTGRARLQMPFVKLGLVPEGASTVLLTARLGRAKAAELLLLGNSISGEEAHRLYLANELVLEDELETRSAFAAKRYAALEPLATVESKRLLKEPERMEVELALEREALSFLARLQTPETRALLEAQLR